MKITAGGYEGTYRQLKLPISTMKSVSIILLPLIFAFTQYALQIVNILKWLAYMKGCTIAVT